MFQNSVYTRSFRRGWKWMAALLILVTAWAIGGEAMVAVQMQTPKAALIANGQLPEVAQAKNMQQSAIIPKTTDVQQSWPILQPNPIQNASQTQQSTNVQNPSPGDLYAKAAVLMDGDSGRILYGKNESEVLPMASTTKVMTLIVTLENASLEDTVTISSYASSMPDVQLNAKAGEQYKLKDLVYSLMLESHNDSAVAIAEHVGGSVEGFAKMMNDKAKSLGCENTHFITPNGLDSADDAGAHATTAADLAKIMRYAIGNDTFLEITRTPTYSFTDLSGNRSFTVNNKNALLTMTEEAISGKTGFTGNAGYCYTCAVESEGRTFIIALLGCGWPPNKSWKWKDTMTLINFGKENYDLKEVGLENHAYEPVDVQNGVKERVFLSCDTQKVKLLLGKHETFKISTSILTQTQAPVKAGDSAGVVEYVVNGQALYRFPVVFKESVERTDYKYYLDKIMGGWF